MILDTAQLDRACGVLVASAVGDALGAGYEFGSAPYDGTPRMIGGGLGDFAPGEWTDDTAQAVAIAQSLVGVSATGADVRSRAGLDAVAQRFADWYAGGPADVGVQTAAVLRAAGRHPTGAAMAAAAKHEHERSGRSAGNGSLMRTSPLALAYLGPGQEAALVEAAHAVSALTHHDPLAGDGAALWCLMVRHAVLHGHFEFVHHHGLLRDPDRWHQLEAEAESRTPGTFTQNAWVVGAFQAAWSAVTRTPVPADDPPRHLQDALATAIGSVTTPTPSRPSPAHCSEHAGASRRSPRPGWSRSTAGPASAPRTWRSSPSRSSPPDVRLPSGHRGARGASVTGPPVVEVRGALATSHETR